MDKKQANKAIAEVVSFIASSEYSEFFDFSQYRIKVSYSDKGDDLSENELEIYHVQFFSIVEKPSGHCKSDRYAIGTWASRTFHIYVLKNGELSLSSFSIKEFNKYYGYEKERQKKSCKF